MTDHIPDVEVVVPLGSDAAVEEAELLLDVVDEVAIDVAVRVPDPPLLPMRPELNKKKQ